jgi:hypothetical protein
MTPMLRLNELGWDARRSARRRPEERLCRHRCNVDVIRQKLAAAATDIQILRNDGRGGLPAECRFERGAAAPSNHWIAFFPSVAHLQHTRRNSANLVAR